MLNGNLLAILNKITIDRVLRYTFYYINVKPINDLYISYKLKF